MSEIIDLHAAEPAEDEASQPRILVVDDAITVRLFYCKILGDAGYQVEEAANGLEGLEKALAFPSRLLLVDVNMPKMDGHEMLRAVRQDPALRAVPALVVSTEGRPRDREIALGAGANFYLTKPIQPDVLRDTVRLMTGGRR
ncbi:response regulator [Marinibaculum pumilum]|uniref:Response regulator n=1 Tax=Marinibaculum pumilum TaxID=1766165 RepID=A0ABV7KTR0_9PROT